MPRVSIDFTAHAWKDLTRLHAFLQQQDDALADDWVAFVMDAVEVLYKQPGIGRPLPGDLRELIIERGNTGYLALYRYVRERHYVRILRIRHQRECGYSEADTEDEFDF
jgi:plasmid stabilization system protein ParE